MDLFTYLLAKNDKFILVHKSDLFAYLLGKNNSIPLKTAEGVTITIEALKTKINELKMMKESTQDGTPTPDNPIPVKVVEGYRNLLENQRTTATVNGITFTVNPDKTITANGTATGIANFDVGRSLNNIFKGNYSFYGCPKDGSSSSYYMTLYKTQEETVSNIRSIYGSNNDINNVAIDEECYLWERITIANGYTAYNLTFKPMIIEGTSSHPYVPYGNNYVDVTVTGKNLFNKDKANIINGFFNTTTGSINSNSNGRTLFIKCNVNTTYTISKRLSARFSIGYTSDTPIVGTSVSGVQVLNNSTSGTLITNDSAKYLVVFYYLSTADTLTEEEILNSIQIEKGSATSYEPYKESIVPIPLNGNFIGGKGNNLDELIVDKFGKCYLKKVITKIDSYNGETITTEYMSTTGGLDIGATIYYVTPSQLIDLHYTIDLKLFKGENNISNSEDMTMILKYY